jgi:hypothetical protein
MMSKDLILVTAYCPTSEKKEVLHDFLKSLQKFREEYDILVSSHSPLDTWFFSYFDYFYFDKNNELLTDIEYRQNAWFKPWDNYVIWSSYTEIGNTHKAVWDLTIPAVNIANGLNYGKIHMFEYDSQINSDRELKENSQLLDKYDYVIYGNENTHQLVGGFISFNVNGVINEHKVLNKTMYEEFYFDKYPKVPENITFELIKNQRSFIKKDHTKLKDNGLEISKVRGNFFDWNVPFYDESDRRLKFIARNLSNKSYGIKIIDNEKFHNLGEIETNTWKIVDLIDFDKIKKLVVFRDDVKVLDLDFETEEYKNRFIKYNSVLTNDSLI